MMSNAYTKNKRREITYETYLDLADELTNDEECHFPVEMNFSIEYLVILP